MSESTRWWCGCRKSRASIFCPVIILATIVLGILLSSCGLYEMFVTGTPAAPGAAPGAPPLIPILTDAATGQYAAAAAGAGSVLLAWLGKVFLNKRKAAASS